MFISTFDLLADARLQIQAVESYLQAQRDFWIAQANLDMAMLGPVNNPLSLARAADSAVAASPAGH